MIFEQITTGGCLSYLLGCSESNAAVIIDPEATRTDRYLGLAARDGLRIHYVIDTHTHADHFSGARAVAAATGALIVMNKLSPFPFADLRLDDGEILKVGDLKLQALLTPGHTRDSMSIYAEDRVFTGDTLLIGGTGRSDLPTGNPDQLYDSLFNRLLKLPPETLVYPAHDYKGRSHSDIATEIATNPRLQKIDRAEFIAMMEHLDLAAPTHLTEALRTNLSGAKTVAGLLAEAAAKVPFVAMADLAAALERGDAGYTLLDVREKESYLSGHISGAIHLPRGQLELRVNELLPDPTARILTICEFGRVSTLAAATLRDLGFTRAVALDGGTKAWREAGLPLASGAT